MFVHHKSSIFVLRWEWTDKWTVDVSSRFGQPDLEGWFYASTFDRLVEMLKTSSGIGISSKTSLVRRRRWVRPLTCVSKDLIAQIIAKSDKITKLTKNIENALNDKQQVMTTLKFYEENRSFVYSQSLHLGTQGTLNTLAILQDISNKLRSFRQV
jgi:hypothetical protein